MVRLGDWGLILIHGLPERGHDHRQQLAGVEQIATTCSIDAAVFDWWPYAGELHTYRLLRSGDFGGVLARRLDEWLHGETAAAAGRRNLVVVAYSLGGLLFYNWLTGYARRSDLARVRQAVMIAAPFQFSTGAVQLQRPDGAWTTLTGLASQRVDPAAIASALRQRLLIVQAEGDRTIIPNDSDVAAVRRLTIPLSTEDAALNSHRALPADGQALLAVTATLARRMVPELRHFR